MEAFKNNDITNMEHLADVDYADMAFATGFSGGKKTFVKNVLRNYRLAASAGESSGVAATAVSKPDAGSAGRCQFM